MHTEEIVKISVRTLVEFIFRSGDLTTSNGSAGIGDVDAMQAGNRIHKKIQKSMGHGYTPEVSLSCKRYIESPESKDSFTLLIEGRADGLYIGNPSTHDNEKKAKKGKINSPSGVLIDEIKGVYLPPDELEDAIYVHRAQAMCYAYMLTIDKDLPQIDVQITYCHIESEHIRRFLYTYTKDEITEWFDNLIDLYTPWAVYSHDSRHKRDASVAKLPFPYPYRKGQDKLVALGYKKIRAGEKLFIQAPTGVGKTLTTVYPAVKAMGEGIISRIFYLTAKTITRTVAEECFATLADAGLIIKPITLTAKEKICILDKPACDPTECVRALGHFDRVNDALYDLVTHEDTLTRDTIAKYADKNNVCPFELGLDASLFSDVVIGDYNYVYDPHVYLRRFFTGGKSDAVILVDEAHNLIERGRQMYSERIVKDDILDVRKLLLKMENTLTDIDAKKHIRSLIRGLNSLNKLMLAWKRQCDDYMLLSSISGLSECILRVNAAYENFLKDRNALPDRDRILSLYFTTKSMYMLLETMEPDQYRYYTDYDDDGHFRFTLQCMDPSDRLKEVMERVKSTILFSATLLPIGYYKEQLGGEKKDAAVYATSSFPTDNKLILIAKDVTSKYAMRGPDMYGRIATYIERFVTSRPGNYMIYFPSYVFMDEVCKGLTLPDSYVLLMQKKDMTEDDREKFLSAFDTNKGDTDDNSISDQMTECDLKSAVVGCCVMGGIFSEGIDLKDDRLIGAAVVGTGLPMVCKERELYKNYFDEKKGHGFDYAYLYPGMGKVLQAGGRVIRTATDKGVILLLDERFLHNEYMSLFPREWIPCETVDIDTLKEKLEGFWNPLQ